MSLDTQPDGHKKSAGAKASRAKAQENAVDTERASVKLTENGDLKPEVACFISQLPSTSESRDRYPGVFEEPVADLSVDANEVKSSKFSMSLSQRLSMRDQNSRHKSSLETERRPKHATVNHCGERSRLGKSSRASREGTFYTSSDDDEELLQGTSCSSFNGEEMLPQSFSRHSSVACAASSTRRQDEISKGHTGKRAVEVRTSRSEAQHDSCGDSKADVKKALVKDQSTFKKTTTTSQVNKNPSQREQGSRERNNKDLGFSGDCGQNEEELTRSDKPYNDVPHVQEKARKKPAKKIFFKVEFSDSSCASSDEEVDFSDRKRNVNTDAPKGINAQPSKERSLETFDLPENVPECNGDSKRVTERTFSDTKEKAAFTETSKSSSSDIDTPGNDRYSIMQSSSVLTTNSCVGKTREGGEEEILRKKLSKENFTELDDSVQSPSDFYMPAPLSQRLSKRLASRDVLRSISLSSGTSSVEYSKEACIGKSVTEGELSSAAIKPKRSGNAKVSGSGDKGGTVSSRKTSASTSGSVSSPIVLD